MLLKTADLTLRVQQNAADLGNKTGDRRVQVCSCPWKRFPGSCFSNCLPVDDSSTIISSPVPLNVGLWAPNASSTVGPDCPMMCAINKSNPPLPIYYPFPFRFRICHCPTILFMTQIQNLISFQFQRTLCKMALWVAFLWAHSHDSPCAAS